MAKFSKIFRGKVRDTSLVINTPEVFERWLSILGEDQPVEIIVRRPKMTRTNPQNNYYWGVIVDRIAEELGMLPDEVNRMLEGMFLKEEFHHEGKVYFTVGKAKELDKGEEWDNYTRRCRVWANQELEMWIPEPNEVEFDDTI